MSLANLLSVEQIVPDIKATERWPAIVELIDLLVRLGKIKPADRDSILASLKQREETMSTGIGFGIAIPHCSSDRLDEVVAPETLHVAEAKPHDVDALHAGQPLKLGNGRDYIFDPRIDLIDLGVNLRGIARARVIESQGRYAETRRCFCEGAYTATRGWRATFPVSNVRSDW